METKSGIINTYIIPVLNNYEGLYRLLETLEKYTSPNYQVIVIDNGVRLKKEESDLEYIEMARRFKQIALWIEPYRNLGFGKAMNTGIKLATTEFITCANDDVEIMYEGWWDEVMNLFASNPKLAGLNPHSPCNKMHTGERVLEYEYKREYNVDDIKKIKEFFKGQKWYVGCCTYFTIFKKSLFDEIGYFDESFGQGSGEDYDLCIRAARADKLIVGSSNVIVFHWWGKTKDNMPVEEGGYSNANYDLIAKGNQRLTEKWGAHCQEVERQLKDGRMTEEQAKAINNGWSVCGTGGASEPLDKDKVNYKNNQWYQIMLL